MAYSDILTWNFTGPEAWASANWDSAGVPGVDSVLMFNPLDEGVSDISCHWEGPSSEHWIQSIGAVLLNADSSVAFVGDGAGQMGAAPNIDMQSFLTYSNASAFIQDGCWMRCENVSNYGDTRVNHGRLDITGDLLQYGTGQLWVQGGADMSIGGDVHIAKGHLWSSGWDAIIHVGGDVLFEGDTVNTATLSAGPGSIRVDGTVGCAQDSQHGILLPILGTLQCGSLDLATGTVEVAMWDGVIEVDGGVLELPDDGWQIAQYAASTGGDATFRLVHGGSMDCINGTLTLSGMHEEGTGRLVISSVDLDGVVDESQISQATVGTLIAQQGGGVDVEGAARLTVLGNAHFSGQTSGTGEAFRLTAISDGAEASTPSMYVGGDLALASAGGGVVGQVNRGQLDVMGDIEVGTPSGMAAASALWIGEPGASPANQPVVTAGGDLRLGWSGDGTDAGFGTCSVRDGVLVVTGEIDVSSSGGLLLYDGAVVHCGGLDLDNGSSLFQIAGRLSIKGNADIDSGALEIPRAGYGGSGAMQLEDGTASSSLDCDVTIGGSSEQETGYFEISDGSDVHISGQLRVGRGTGGTRVATLRVDAGATLVADGEGPVIIDRDGVLEVSADCAEQSTFACDVLLVSGSVWVGYDASASIWSSIDAMAGTMSLRGGSSMWSPAMQLGTLTMDSDAELVSTSCSFSDATTTIQFIGVSDAGGCIRTGTLALDGSLDLFVYGDGDLAGRGSRGLHAGSVCPIMSAGLDVSGEFDSVQITNGTSQSGAALSLQQDATGLALVVTAAIPGDGDLDGHVDRDDLVRLLTNWGRTSGDGTYQLYSEDDYDRSGVVDVRDLIDLLVNWTN
jgi:hypothetical protein